MYDLNLSMDVVESMKSISNFTRIQEVLKTVIVTQENLNKIEEEEHAKKDLDMKNAKIANRSLSCNEPAEGYICPVCYFALSGQEELISHWQAEHNLDECDNETFQEVEMPNEEHSLLIEDGDSTAVILSPKERRAISEGEDVLGTLEQIEFPTTESDSNENIPECISRSDDVVSSNSIVSDVEYVLQGVIDMALIEPDVSIEPPPPPSESTDGAQS